MEIVQEIGSYAGFAAVLGLAVLSALYFSQARDVKRLREWAGRAPERTTAPAPAAVPQKRVVAQPIAKPGGPGPVVPRPPGAPAAASATGAGPAIAAGGPAPATPAAAQSAAGASPADAPSADAEREAEGGETGETAVEEPRQGLPSDSNGSADTPETPAPSPTDEPEAAEPDDGDTSENTVAVPALESAERTDEPEDTGEWTPEAEHSDYDFTDEHEALPAAKPLPPRPPQPFPRRAGATPAGRTGRGSILPPYEQSRPSTEPEGRTAGSRRPILLAVAAILGLAVLAFGVLQLTGGEDSGGGDGAGLSANRSTDGADGNQPVDPSSVTVAVLNGTTQPGLAAQIGDQIANEGFIRGVVTNNSDQARAESVVLYAAGAEREAIDVSRRLDIPQREPIDAASQDLAGDATVVVIAGADQIR
jgi:hypothetical protein